MVSSKYRAIREAIQNKDFVTGRYLGYRRVMCPHVIGLNKDDREQALFYQFGGGSSSGLGPDGSSENWRCIPLDGFTEVEVVSANGEWHTGSSHTKAQHCVKRIDLKVKF